MNNRFIILLSLFMLFSCAGKNENDTTSNFIVDEISYSSVSTFKTIQSDGIEEIKDLAKIHTKICIKDPSVGAAIVDNSFTIKDGYTSQIKTTDFQGCFNFEMNVPYNTLQCEQYTKHNLKIDANGNYSGSQNIQLLINPSSSTTKILFDSRYETPNELKPDNCNATKLITKVNKITRVRTKKSVLGLDLDLNVSLQRSLINGEKRNIPIKSNGDFEISARILTEYRGDTVELSKTRLNSKIQNGRLQSRIEFNTKAILNNDSDNYILELTIIPLSDTRLASFKGQIVSNDIYFSNSTQIEEIEESISANKIDTKSLESEVSPIDLKEITIKEVTQVNSDQFAQDKTKLVILNLCLFDKLSQFGSEPIVNTEIIVKSSVIEILQLQKRTDESGCVEISTKLDYKLFEMQKWTQTDIEASIKEDKVELSVSRKIEINPWLDSPVRDLKHNKVLAEEISTSQSMLHIDSVTYKQIENVDSSYYVNKFAQLFFKKKFSIEFNPMVEMANNYNEYAKLKSLNFGDFTTKYFLYSADKSVSLKDGLDFSNMTLISATEEKSAVSKHGKFYVEPKFPLEISDALNLSVRSIVIMEITPTSGLDGLSKGLYAFEFYGTNSKDTVAKAFKLSDDSSFTEQGNAKSMIKDKHAFSMGLSKKLTGLNSLDLYKQRIAKIYGESNVEFLDYSKLINSKVGKRAKISIKDLRRLTQIKNKVPKAGDLRKKICLLDNKDSGFFNSKIDDCVENFQGIYNVHGASHITDIVSFNKYSKENEVTKAHIIAGSEENNGDLNRGTAFMAAKGYRASHDTGSREGVAETMQASLYYDGPPSIFMLSAGITHTQETFSLNVDAKMQMEFNRNFSTLTKVKLTYESFAAIFTAQIKRCIIIEKIKSKTVKHICEDAPYFKDITEKWYFIGEKDARKHGVITDGVQVGEKSYLRVIRGEKNFKQIWARFENEDSRAIIKTMDNFELGKKFKELKSGDTVDIDYETYKDNSFPGLIN